MSKYTEPIMAFIRRIRDVCYGSEVALDVNSHLLYGRIIVNPLESPWHTLQRLRKILKSRHEYDLGFSLSSPALPGQTLDVSCSTGHIGPDYESWHITRMSSLQLQIQGHTDEIIRWIEFLLRDRDFVFLDLMNKGERVSSVTAAHWCESFQVLLWSAVAAEATSSSFCIDAYEDSDRDKYISTYAVNHRSDEPAPVGIPSMIPMVDPPDMLYKTARTYSWDLPASVLDSMVPGATVRIGVFSDGNLYYTAYNVGQYRNGSLSPIEELRMHFARNCPSVNGCRLNLMIEAVSPNHGKGALYWEEPGVLRRDPKPEVMDALTALGQELEVYRLDPYVFGVKIFADQRPLYAGGLSPTTMGRVLSAASIANEASKITAFTLSAVQNRRHRVRVPIRYSEPGATHRQPPITQPQDDSMAVNVTPPGASVLREGEDQPMQVVVESDPCSVDGGNPYAEIIAALRDMLKTPFMVACPQCGGEVLFAGNDGSVDEGSAAICIPCAKIFRWEISDSAYLKGVE